MANQWVYDYEVFEGRLYDILHEMSEDVELKSPSTEVLKMDHLITPGGVGPTSHGILHVYYRRLVTLVTE